MSSHRRTLSKDKKQLTASVDVEALKLSISRPQNLQPRHILEEQIKKRKEAREAEVAQENANHTSESSSHQPAQPPTHHRSTSQDSLFKKSLKIIFRNAQRCKYCWFLDNVAKPYTSHHPITPY
jgi:hypothetical protein